MTFIKIRLHRRNFSNSDSVEQKMSFVHSYDFHIRPDPRRLILTHTKCVTFHIYSRNIDGLDTITSVRPKPCFPAETETETIEFRYFLDIDLCN
jgi:hypothetical protein